MAHAAKYSRAAVGHLFAHFERAKDANGEYIKFANQSIDPERTAENYNLASEQEMSQGAFMRQCLGDENIHVPSRKDLNVMCSWIVTLPKDIDRADSREFMERAYDFLKDRYGENNVISAHVHMDEMQPHMHFAFIPVTVDQKTGGLKVSAKDVVNRQDLRTFHADLDRHMERLYGRNIGILNEATREGNKSIEELKRGNAVAKLKETIERAERAEQRASAAEQKLGAIRDEYNVVAKDKNTVEKALEGHLRETGVRPTLAEQGAIDVVVRDHTRLVKREAVYNQVLEDYPEIKNQVERVFRNRELEPTRATAVIMQSAADGVAGLVEALTRRDDDNVGSWARQSDAKKKDHDRTR